MWLRLMYLICKARETVGLQICICLVCVCACVYIHVCAPQHVCSHHGSTFRNWFSPTV